MTGNCTVKKKTTYWSPIFALCISIKGISNGFPLPLKSCELEQVLAGKKKMNRNSYGMTYTGLHNGVDGRAVATQALDTALNPFTVA